MKDDNQKRKAKDQLRHLVKKRIDTTMIGSLASIEKYLGFLWGHNSDGDLTPEQERLADLYEDLRSEILDKGNNQIRNFDTDFETFEVSNIRHYLFLPVKRTGNERRD